MCSKATESAARCDLIISCKKRQIPEQTRGIVTTRQPSSIHTGISAQCIEMIHQMPTKSSLPLSTDPGGLNGATLLMCLPSDSASRVWIQVHHHCSHRHHHHQYKFKSERSHRHANSEMSSTRWQCFRYSPKIRRLLTFWPKILDVYSLLTTITPTILDVLGLFFRRKNVRLGVNGNPARW